MTEKVEIKKITNIEIGPNYTATINIPYIDDLDETKKIDFKFKVHIPTTVEDLKISIKEEQLLGQRANDEYVNLAARMLAVLSVVVDEIYFIDSDSSLKKFNGDFLFLANTIKQIGKFYKELVIPIYNEFIDFQNSITKTSFDELRNLLTNQIK